MRRSALLALLAVAPLFAAEAPKEGADKELDKLQGLWQVVGVEEGGKMLPREKTRGWALTVKGKKYTFRAGETTIAGTYQLDPSHTPKWVDAKRTEGKEEGKTLKGIYEIKADELTMCFADPGEETRPKAFTTREGGGKRLYVFRRAKP